MILGIVVLLLALSIFLAVALRTALDHERLRQDPTDPPDEPRMIRDFVEAGENEDPGPRA